MIIINILVSLKRSLALLTTRRSIGSSASGDREHLATMWLGADGAHLCIIIWMHERSSTMERRSQSCRGMLHHDVGLGVQISWFRIECISEGTFLYFHYLCFLLGITVNRELSRIRHWNNTKYYGNIKLYFWTKWAKTLQLNFSKSNHWSQSCVQRYRWKPQWWLHLRVLGVSNSSTNISSCWSTTWPVSASNRQPRTGSPWKSRIYDWICWMVISKRLPATGCGGPDSGGSVALFHVYLSCSQAALDLLLDTEQVLGAQKDSQSDTHSSGVWTLSVEVNTDELFQAGKSVRSRRTKSSLSRSRVCIHLFVTVRLN